MEKHMLVDSEANAAARERLSALLDGELDGRAVAEACAHWRESAESRATWHAWHLIGDVLRSDDLASDSARDTAFLDALRAKLANEPVVLAPKPLETPAVGASPAAGRAVAGRGLRRWGWIAPSAVAAGFVAVAGVLTLTRPGVLPERNDATGVAQAAAPASFAGAAALVSNPAALAPEPQTFVASGQVIRDARLDRYLAAHKQFAGSSALGVPSGYLRNATAEVATGR
jgi:sigma-E factor negative regulatory protein RseA